MAKRNLSQERLKEVLHYDQNTGVFTWLIETHAYGGTRFPGDVAGCHRPDGYIDIGIDGGRYLAHHLAFLWMTGEMPVTLPKFRMDHKDWNRSNNRWDNLRLVTNAGNLQNQHAARKNNKLGVLGVRQMNSKFEARITVGGVQLTIGYFATAELAHIAYVEAKRKLHPAAML
jgi:hypothetical protein